jgi:hypothetical protein
MEKNSIGGGLAENGGNQMGDGKREGKNVWRIYR